MEWYKGRSHQRPVIALLKLRLVLPLAVLLALGGCSWLGLDSSSDDDKKAKMDPASIPPEELYSHGIDALHAQHYDVATSQFDDLEQNYPYSTWAVSAQLMEGYAEYRQEHYTDAIGTLDRFIQLHPTHRDIAYAYYLRALCYYEQIADIQRDQKGTQDALDALQEVVNRFPDTAYGRDARLKIDLARDHLAGKEMEIGRWYERQHLYTAAIGRFQRVVDDFQTTNHVPEALHRLTECYLALGLTEQARRTAAVLGHNYPGSSWYEDSYNDLVGTGVAQGAPSQAGSGEKSRPGFFGRLFGAVF